MKTIKPITAMLSIITLILALTACETTKPNNMTVTTVATTSASTTIDETTTNTTTTTTSVTTSATASIVSTSEETTTSNPTTTLEMSNEDIQSLTTQDIVYRSYRYTGEEDGTMAEPYILVEQNYKKKYVSFYMQFIGVNAFLSPDWDENLNVIDGSYWIQDFQNADGSEPDLTKVYVKYSPAQITLLYWDNGEDRWLSEYPQEFVYQPD